MQTIVLLHDSADGASSWAEVAQGLSSSGHEVLRPDLLGYGSSRPPSCCYKVAKEVEHLKRCVDARQAGSIHLAGHGYGAFVALHLRAALGPRVKSLTLVSPIVAGVLKECGEAAAQAELDQLYRRFMSLSTHNESAANFLIDHWRGQGAWQAMTPSRRGQIAALIPKIRREMVALQSDRSRLAGLARSWLPAAVLIGQDSRRPVRAAGWRLAEAFETAPILVDGAAHMIPQTHPEAVIEVISHLATVEVSRRPAPVPWAGASMPHVAVA
jgi:pimeloyl-ACP methyl ester carboxylesterase